MEDETFEGLRQTSFLYGIEESAKRLNDSSPMITMQLLELLRTEMKSQWLVEQEISTILPVHNIGALSIDTVNLKNVLKMESRAWKMLYGNILLAHAQGLMKALTGEVDAISNIMKQSKGSETNVHQMIKFVSASFDAEQFERSREQKLLTLELILQWAEECEINTDLLRRSFDALHSNIVSMMRLKDAGQSVVAHERERLLAKLSVEVNAAKEGTNKLLHDMLSDVDGPLASSTPSEETEPRLSVLKTLLIDLAERWQYIMDAEHALQLPPSDISALTKLQVSRSLLALSLA